MNCPYCNATLMAGARFCPACGKEQPAASATASMPSMPAASLPDAGQVMPGNRTPLVAGALAVVALALGGGGYWAWDQHQAAEGAARKVNDMEQAAAQMKKQNEQAAQTAQTAAAQAARATEEAEKLAVAVAQAALDKAIAEQEEQARIKLTSARR